MLITGKTNITGIFGYPVEHTLSPVMHNAAFQSMGLDYLYVPFEVNPSNLAGAVSALKALGIKGVNVTIPHKQEVMPFLDEISQEARLIGAVNTIVNKDGTLIGYNTDGRGFVRSLEEKGVAIKGASLIIVGAGGAARAVAVQCALAGADEIIFRTRAEDLESGQNIVKIIKANSKSAAKALRLEENTGEWGSCQPIIINCTPLGMYPAINQLPPISLKEIPENTVVCDLVYNPVETLFLQEAGSLGLKTVSGLGMLLHQGTAAFELWTGQPAPVLVMRSALAEAISDRTT